MGAKLWLSGLELSSHSFREKLNRLVIDTLERSRRPTIQEAILRLSLTLLIALGESKNELKEPRTGYSFTRFRSRRVSFDDEMIKRNKPR